MQDLYDMIADLQARVKYLESKNRQKIAVYPSTTASKNTNINNVAVTALSFNNSLSNVGTLFSHSTSTNDSRVTINRKATVLMLFTAACSSSTANTSVRFRYRINGSTLERPSIIAHIVNAGGDAEDGVLLARVYDFSAGDYVEVVTDLQGAAGTVTLTSTQSLFEVYEIFQ